MVYGPLPSTMFLIQAWFLMALNGRSGGITALSVFFLFGAAMSSLTVFMLLFRGGALEPLWMLNPRARDGFAAMGFWALPLMAVVCVACGTAALGLWRCTRWGFWTAAMILSVNLAGDTINAIFGRDWHTLIGLPVGGSMLVYLIAKRRLFLS